MLSLRSSRLLLQSTRTLSQSLPRSSRNYTIRSATHNQSRAWKTAILLSGGIGVASILSIEKTKNEEERKVRTSVLDEDSLKRPIHKTSEDKLPAEEMVASKETQASSEGAFNEETGEINWDCPCLGGMAHGPCGEQFRNAFSCFVFSEAEPKGMDCVELFKAMQDCFREHPDIYGEEIDDESEISGTPAPEGTEGIPKPPNTDPPVNSPVLGVTPDKTPSKGEEKLKPSGKQVTSSSTTNKAKTG
ncbi:hypothetical protein M231_01614 [Tremella mesenterica]|uniref:Mitochondrial intermembrane space import and assembly protein 40 n=1 Tax=Tremella mesenterica TaxID=5217 RepID=A0A4Q1BT32_TREME|nr:uncharacterized protein TREMEDRAFT_72212 [Tremella mesenterica DSM 1558]EIW67304.1 hypothetical protein TREMEDRAFT_72212 [Tremella mesenterica DSM 1558]RXK41209.1 hypothetical protein M231_01614 [Tremella mesenterica]